VEHPIYMWVNFSHCGHGHRQHSIQWEWDLLTYVLVLVQAFFSNVALLKLHTKVQILLHNRLMDFLPCSMSFAFDDIIQSIQSSLLLPNVNKLYKKQQFCIIWQYISIQFTEHYYSSGEKLLHGSIGTGWGIIWKYTGGKNITPERRWPCRVSTRCRTPIAVYFSGPDKTSTDHIAICM